MNIRPVKTEGDYDAALDRIEALWGAASGTPEGNELDVLLTLVNVYENERHPVPPPSPVEAIKFIMDQQGLKQADLIPFMGTRSKVSEVLNGKRPLTLSMIRALHAGLGIPAETLIRDEKGLPRDGRDVDWGRFPVAEVISLGWVKGLDPKTQQEEIMRDLASQAGAENFFAQAVCFRQGSRKNAKDDPFALQTWVLKLMIEAKALKAKVRFKQQEINHNFLRKVAHLSVFSNGPLMAREYLQNKGIKLVIAPHLKRTYVDAAVFLEHGATPVIGMSLRYDRIDYFWFTLLHELSHIALKHITKPDECIIEDLELRNSLDDAEKAADQTAQNALIPDKLWLSSPVRTSTKIADVVSLAREADIHPAIVAGRVRHEKGNFRLFSRQVGHGQVRGLFG